MINAKADTSPVTEADRKAEAAMRAMLQEAVPTHGVFGEEEGLTLGSSSSGGAAAGPSYLWVLDPIDGTKSFITGEAPCESHTRTRTRVCGLLAGLGSLGVVRMALTCCMAMVRMQTW